jgi:sugar lactone lactonase YvrE
MLFGSGDYTYELEQGWGKLHDRDWKWGAMPAVACDSQDRVYVYSRSERPLVVFDRAGDYVDSWGDDLPRSAHGICVDGEDNVYCVDAGSHCLYKFNRHGDLVMTLGTPGQPSERDSGEPFNSPTDVGIASTGELFISDGYGNKQVHKFSPDGELLLTWGGRGSGPGQFELPHGLKVDRYDRVWVCDRANYRVQIFDIDGSFLAELTGLQRPTTVCFDPNDDVVYIAQLERQLSIYTLEGELITEWGGREKVDTPGEFMGGPHAVWVDSHGDLYVGEVLVDGRLQKLVRQK